MAYFSVLFFTILGNTVLQYSLISKHISMQLLSTSELRQTASLSLLIIASAIIWIGSGSVIISQNATL
jgi:hypothetical protein